MGWRDRIVQPTDTQPKSTWRDRIIPAPQEAAVSQEPQTSLPEAIGEGIKSGATLNLGDELSGLIDVGLSKTGRLFTGGAPNPYEDMSVQDVYRQGQQEALQQTAKAQEEHPWGSAFGNIVGGLPTMAAGSGVKAAMALGGVGGAGAAESISDIPTEAAKGIALGYGMDKLSKVIPATKASMSKGAEDLAVSATEATGKQMSNFAPTAGRELLDRKAVTAGATPEVIAQRLKAQMGTAEEGIDLALRELTDQGANVDAQTILNTVSKRVGDLSADPATAPIARGLNTVKNDMLESYTRPDVNPTLIDFETTKRGFKKAAGNWQNPLEGQVGKEAYHIYQKAVEDAATATNPELAKRFIEEKQLYKLLAPIQEAAERKAISQSQAPIVSGIDLAVGVATGNPLSTVASAGTRKIIAPRIKSTAAVGMDTMSKILPNISPKYQSMLSQGGRSAAINHFLLSSQDPEYNAEVNRILSEQEQEK